MSKTTMVTTEPVRVVRKRLMCECGGEFTREGTLGMGVKASMLAKYPHKCTGCEEVTWIRGKSYPVIGYESVEEPNE